VQHDPDELVAAATTALAEANAEVERCRAAERRLEAVVAGVLHHVPLPVLVTDRSLTIWGCSARAREQQLRPGASLPRRLADAAAAVIEEPGATGREAPQVDGWHLATVPGDATIVVLWQDPFAARAG
jgi:hypothetical protein